MNKSYGNSILIRSLSKQSNSSNNENENDDSLLLKEIAKQIRFTGPLTVNDYMRLALTHPKYGFYMRQDVFGEKGHFITSPEISQIFGELIAIWIMYQWQKYSNGRQLDIIELGPGRGTLSTDIARSMEQFTQTRPSLNDCHLHLIEISPFLQSIQQQNLCNHIPNNNDNDNLNEMKSTKRTKYGQSIHWYPSIDQFRSINEHNENRFPIFIANEFFDAFPIHKFIKNSQQQKWNELLIDHDERGNQLRWIQSRNDTPMTKLLSLNGHFDRIDSPKINHFEYSPMIFITIDKIIDYIERQQQPQNDCISGCILICDYGFDSDHQIDRDTFRAYYQHKQLDPLLKPGMADLTADVDFAAIRHYVSERNVKKKNVNIKCFGAIEQRQFLSQMGIGFRLKQLLQQQQQQSFSHQDNNNTATTVQRQKELISSARILMDEMEMGIRFKFMAIFINGQQMDGDDDEKPVGFWSMDKSNE
ncbi:putative s-adenosyl-l-methionine-dependent methyltransferase-like protein [Dermatophagoides farinae]|uniref:Protein arginine methyltransferase NDUFAF7 n=1 Tax=Dermatophagoides farinae TaxID=6954 RepID=A0A9D4P4E9_DERFA|nr:putative s-adenosyl-l-methionine-dependent methyltransferase-like protein [Dermatophagoides farinae]